MRGGERWTAMEFADLCESVALELRSRARVGAIAPRERLALFQWYGQLKDIVHRLEAARRRPAEQSSDGAQLRLVRAVGDR